MIGEMTMVGDWIAQRAAEYAATVARLEAMTGAPAEVCQAIIDVFVARRQSAAVPNHRGLQDAVAAVARWLTPADLESIAQAVAIRTDCPMPNARQVVRRAFP